MAILKIKVHPSAGRNEIGGMWLDMVKIKVTAPPENGKANRACIELLSKELGIPKSSIQLIKGKTSREKQLQIKDLTALQLTDKLKKTH